MLQNSLVYIVTYFSSKKKNNYVITVSEINIKYVSKKIYDSHLIHSNWINTYFFSL